MKVIDPGHVYDLNWVDGDPTSFKTQGPLATIFPAELRENRLIFVKREGEKYPGNVGHHPGTQIQEVCRALIDRLSYVQGQEPHGANLAAIRHLRMVMYHLELRAARRHGRTFAEFTDDPIELFPTCPKCGHIGCEGACR